MKEEEFTVCFWSAAALLNLTYSCYITIFFQKLQPTADKAIVVMPSDQQDYTQ